MAGLIVGLLLVIVGGAVLGYVIYDLWETRP